PPPPYTHSLHDALPIYAHTAFIGNVSIPHGIISIQTDPIGNAVAQVGPDSAVRQTSIAGNVESGESLAMGLSKNQGCIVGRDRQDRKSTRLNSSHQIIS